MGARWQGAVQWERPAPMGRVSGPSIVPAGESVRQDRKGTRELSRLGQAHLDRSDRYALVDRCSRLGSHRTGAVNVAFRLLATRRESALILPCLVLLSNGTGIRGR